MRTDLFLLLAAIGNIIAANFTINQLDQLGLGLTSIIFFVGAAIIFELKPRK